MIGADLLRNGPVFKAKELQTDDIIMLTINHADYQYRVVANTNEEIQVEKHTSSDYKTPKRISHMQLDKSGFVHIGTKPGWFKNLFVTLNKF